MLASFPIMYFLVLKCVTDTNYFFEEGVIPPGHVGSTKSEEPNLLELETQGNST